LAFAVAYIVQGFHTRLVAHATRYFFFTKKLSKKFLPCSSLAFAVAYLVRGFFALTSPAAFQSGQLWDTSQQFRRLLKTWSGLRIVLQNPMFANYSFTAVSGCGLNAM